MKEARVLKIRRDTTTDSLVAPYNITQLVEENSLTATANDLTHRKRMLGPSTELWL